MSFADGSLDVHGGCKCFGGGGGGGGGIVSVVSADCC